MASVTIQADENVERMLIAMRDAGLPRDQAERFTLGGYVPLQGMLPFHAWARQADRGTGPEWVAMGGKRGPGKSHTAMAQVGLDDCQRIPGLKGLFIRKIQRAARQSLEDVIMQVFRYTPHTLTQDGVTFRNGSRLLIGGYKDERDIEKYLGIQYDVIVIEEATQLIESKVDKLRGSLRSAKPGWRPRIYLTTNADGPGLQWFKREFVVPAREGRETATRFLDVTHIHNPFINDEYDQWLGSLTGNLAKAWRDGDWDAFAGQAFPNWNHARHVVDPFDIPAHWLRWKATDWGSAAPFCTLWFAKDLDTRRVIVYRELYRAGLTDRQQARAILDMSPMSETYTVHYADPALWERKNYNNRVFSTADEYKAEGIILTRANNDRLGGKRKVNNALADLPDGEPGLQVFSTCPHTIEQMESLASDELNPEDVDTQQEDHAYDTLRYGLTNERKLEQPKTPAATNTNPLMGISALGTR